MRAFPSKLPGEAGKRRPEDRQCCANDITRLDQRKQCEHPAALRTSGAGTSVSGEALPAHEAGQRGTPVSGEALPAHEAGQRGTPVSGEALPAHEASQRGTPVSGKALPAHEAISERRLGRSAF